ncbi:unnamed protein product [Gongylonema pulchrum]|uniref:Uncharacterized protein n=1 Tax=Gongylonema pulchrum TaxID=637853 RepID=A0A3P6PJS7_9BILA|nr:unnamed protein product [Gongylonema pulchrum]
MRAMSDLSVDQTVTLLKISDREKSKSANATSKAKIPSKRRRADTDLADTAAAAAGDVGQFAFVRRGVQWIDEMMISVMKAKRVMEPNERNEKQILLETSDLHNNLVMLAAGIVLRTPGAQKTCTMGEKLQQQNLALDVIEWLIDNWVYTSAQ